MSDRPIAILGAGGLGREDLASIGDAHPKRVVAGFIDDNADSGSSVAGMAVLGDHVVARESAKVVVAVGSPTARRDVMDRLAQERVVPLTVVHPTAYLAWCDGRSRFIICPNVTIARDTRSVWASSSITG